MPTAYEELLDRLREGAVLASASNLLGWDQETMMPPGGGESRAEALSLLARLTHERMTDPRIGELLERCENDHPLRDDESKTANLREIRRDFDRASKLPSTLVAEMSATNSRAVEAWKESRKQKDFELFRPWLERQVELNRRKAECYGWAHGGEAYDALVDEFEPGLTAAGIERVFSELRQSLAPLLGRIRECPPIGTPASWNLEIPLDRQEEFNRFLLARIGFELESGRLDVSAHPFSSAIAPGDTRITTRYRDDDFTESLSGTLHEAGHALYEQGVSSRKHWGQPLGQSLGLAIHESQSWLWENHVGRSFAFWEWVIPAGRPVLGCELDGLSPEDAYRAVNAVRPNLIRVDSDEATYNLHIMLRFDLERALVRDDLRPADLPEAWNRRIEADLELAVPDDSRGCLQDIHWAMGAIGYFPTYALGNLYAAQFFDAARDDIEDLGGRIRSGDFGPLLTWLRRRVHVHGRRWSASDLCRRISGRDLDHGSLIRHLDDKLTPLYGLPARG